MIKREPAFSLVPTHKKDPEILLDMAAHYSQPKGFVGRSICYRIDHDGVCMGHIVAGSATLHLVGRNGFFALGERPDPGALNGIVNNSFFHVRQHLEYPTRNFVPSILGLFRRTVQEDWKTKYGDKVLGFETLVELPRKGECYARDKWTFLGVTKGFTAKREGGTGSDSWSGRRVWDTVNLRPKKVFAKRVQ